jgi:cysteine desulfurase
MTVPAGRSYLDWNATAPLRPQARDAMVQALECLGNPSSVHAEGRRARHLVEAARAEVAALVGAEPAQVVFTSGGTEANHLVLGPGTAMAGDPAPRDVLLVSGIEHASAWEGGRFPEPMIERLPVQADGRLDIETLAARLEHLAASGRTRPLVALMLANNETGVLQPVAEAAAVVHRFGGLLHVDAVQALGRMPVDIQALGADFLAVSAHKIGGPQGAGAVICRGSDLLLAPPARGGGQERGRRPGTENVAAIAGFGAAAAALRVAGTAEHNHMKNLQSRFETGLLAAAPSTVVFGADSPRLPNTTLFAVPGGKAETALIAFDLAGVAVSSGSACSSGKVKPSHVLAAMGVPPELAGAAIRVSIGPTTTEADLARALDAWRAYLRTLPVMSSGLAA